MKKGFTLIELLAVLVILAIIAMITVPLILDIINTAKKESADRSKELYLTAVEQAVAKKNLNKPNEEFDSTTCEVNSTGNLDCKNLEEYGEIIVEVEGLKPTAGSVIFEDGRIIRYKLVINNQIYIYPDYVKNGLVIWFDGIDNTGESHNDKSNVWKDLSGNNNDATLQNYEEFTWDIDSLIFNGINQYAKVNTPSNIPLGNSNYTLEVVFKTNELNEGGLVNLGTYNKGGNSNGLRLYNNGFRHYYWHNDLDYVNKLEIDKTYTVTVLNYGNDRRLYLNSKLGVSNVAVPNTVLGDVEIGRTLVTNYRYFNGNIYSVRAYNRALSEDEINYNFEADKLRFNIS